MATSSRLWGSTKRAVDPISSLVLPEKELRTPTVVAVARGVKSRCSILHDVRQGRLRAVVYLAAAIGTMHKVGISCAGCVLWPGWHLHIEKVLAGFWTTILAFGHRHCTMVESSDEFLAWKAEGDAGKLCPELCPFRFPGFSFQASVQNAIVHSYSG